MVSDPYTVCFFHEDAKLQAQAVKLIGTHPFLTSFTRKRGTRSCPHVCNNPDTYKGISESETHGRV